MLDFFLGVFGTANTLVDLLKTLLHSVFDLFGWLPASMQFLTAGALVFVAVLGVVRVFK